MKPLLLLDGDLILYRNTIACEKEIQWDEQNWVLFLNAENAWDNIQSAIENIKKDLESDRVVLTFSQGRSFRYDLLPTYKSNRKDLRKPLGYSSLVERAKSFYKWRSFDGLEADDVMGILATNPANTSAIIVSDDKDMKTIPGLLYRQGELHTITQEQADYWHLFQTLVGDPTDGFTGMPGCGPKTAERLLTGSVEPWRAIVEAFEAKGLTEDDALTQARLARILRTSEWDTKNKEIKHWTPPIHTPIMSK